MSTPNWPIEIGSIYKDNHNFLTIAGSRVTNIDGEYIHYEDVTAKGYARDSPTKRACSAEIFRALHHPQDISPTPALYAYLERVAAWLGNHIDQEGSSALIDDALKLLEARANLITEKE